MSRNGDKFNKNYCLMTVKTPSLYQVDIVFVF